MVQFSILNFLHPYLKFYVSSIDLSQSEIRILYNLQKDNGIPQSANSSWTGIFTDKFVIYDQYIKFATLLLISIYQKW